MQIYAGTWFVVPKKSGGFGVGVAARFIRKSDDVLVYLFARKRENIPPLAELAQLHPSSASKVTRIPYVKLKSGVWQIIGHMPQWQISLWPIPPYLVRKRKPKPKPDISKLQEAKKLYQTSLYSIGQISRILDISRTDLSTYFKQENMTIRRTYQAPSIATLEKARELYETSGKTIRQICEALNLKEGPVATYLRYHRETKPSIHEMRLALIQEIQDIQGNKTI